VHCQWYFGYFSDRLDNDGTNGDIGHKVAIHDIYVKPICPSRFNGLDFILETAEIGRQD